MRAVWSFWSKPFFQRHKHWWISERHHLLSWVLSVETARVHYPDTLLVTDDAGARLLLDDAGLQFGEVDVCLNALSDADPNWWTLGKLHAYRKQRVPFVHIDNDVFLWNRLPSRLEEAGVFGQNPERFPKGGGWYRPEEWNEAIDRTGGWLPEEWRWYSAAGGNEAVCCGILGGRDVGFLNYYADLAIQVIESECNQAAWREIDRRGSNILAEQYLLSACLFYHAQQPSTSFADVLVRYLFKSNEVALASDEADALGYTHLIGPAKRHPDIAARLDQRVRELHSGLYERVNRAFANARPN